MTKKNSTKRSLILSALSLLLCFSMLIGTTFAWFTDEVSSKNNIIKAGNLDIELYYLNDEVSDWTKVDANTNIFKENTLWEPGHTEVVKLKVVNEGTLALKYQLGVNVASETDSVNVNGEPFKLSDFIKFGIVDGAETYTRDQAIAAAEANGATALNTAWSSGTTMLPVDDKGTTEVFENEKIITMVVYMPTSVGNDANAKNGAAVPTIKLGINLFATQMTAEEDSFNDQYDKDAWHPDFTVASVEDLAEALASGGKIQVNGTLNAGTTQAVPNWTNAPAEFIFDATTLDALKGGKYVLEQGSRYGVVGLISAGESLALSDMEITANSQWPVYLSNYGGTLTLEDINVTATQGAGIYPYGTKGTTTIKSATVNQKALSDEFASSTPWAGTAIATSNGHNLIIEDGTYIGSTWGVYVYNSGANVTINGGTFKAPKVIQADGVWSTGGNKSVVTVNDGNFDGALYLDWGTTPPEIYINGGNFTNFSATVNGSAKLVIKGGTFDADPSAYVATGFNVVEANGTYHVVADGFKVIASAADLVALGGQKLEGTYVLVADINMNGAAMPTIGAAYGKTLTIVGNGHTISNATTAHTAHNGMKHHGFFYAYTNSTLTISDLTFDNIVVDATKDAERNYGAAVVVAFADGDSTINLTNVDVKNSKVLNSTPDIGDEAGIYVGYQTGTLNMVDCDSINCVVAGETDAKTGAFIGMVNGTANVTNCTTDMTIGLCNRIGGTLTVDGAVYVIDAAGLEKAVKAGAKAVVLAEGDYALRFTNNTNFNLNDMTIKGLGNVNLSISSSEAWYGRVQGSNVTFENIHFTSSVGATGEATYNNCTFDSWAICASSNNEETTFNNCTINGCLNTSTDFSSGDVFVNNCKIAKAEYSGSMTMNFVDCEIDEIIIWNANTNLTNCKVTKLDDSNVTTATVTIK